MGKHLKIWEAAALMAVCAVLCIGTWADARQEEICASVIRLHVIAESDDEHEQAIKLRVRDAVLEVLSPMLDGVIDKAYARTVLRSRLTDIREAALSASEGRSVQVFFGEENYPVRSYNGFSLPAGEYESLRVVLGSGEGHNWWCIAFPPLCTAEADSDALRAVMGGESYDIVSSSGVEVRFRAVELWGELRLWLDGLTI